MEWKSCLDLRKRQRRCAKLPDGKTCADCLFVKGCALVSDVKPNSVFCVFDPICFKQKGALTVKRTTEDFTDLKIANERGWYRKHYFCPTCTLEIAIETYEGDYMFGSGSVLRDNTVPQYCPYCGTRVWKEG